MCARARAYVIRIPSRRAGTALLPPPPTPRRPRARVVSSKRQCAVPPIIAHTWADSCRDFMRSFVFSSSRNIRKIARRKRVFAGSPRFRFFPLRLRRRRLFSLHFIKTRFACVFLTGGFFFFNFLVSERSEKAAVGLMTPLYVHSFFVFVYTNLIELL